LRPGRRRRAQPVEKAGIGALVPGRDLRPVFVLADAGVDEDGPPVQAQDEALNRAFQDVAGEVDEIRLEQAALPAQRRQVEPRQEFPERQLEIIVVDHHVDDDLADDETHVSSPFAHRPAVPCADRPAAVPLCRPPRRRESRARTQDREARRRSDAPPPALARAPSASFEACLSGGAGRCTWSPSPMSRFTVPVGFVRAQP
jgi:hypothetical protein